MPTNFNAGEAEVYPGTRGMVVREEAGERVLEAMSWGFPFRPKGMKPDSKPKPVNNIRDLNGYLWKFIAGKPEHRCIIPLTDFCEAEGEKGRMTRTYFRVAGHSIFAWAGLWKTSDEWGPVYSGVMTDCNEAIRPVHDRMPVLLLPEDWDRWLRGSLEDAQALKDRCFPDDLIEMERTTELWRRAKAAA